MLLSMAIVIDRNRIMCGAKKIAVTWMRSHQNG